MGLVKNEDQYAILTDIAGAEDHYGDMDFKVAGTADGITGLQMDIKIGGITSAILIEALAQAKEGRLFILERMAAAIAAPRAEISPHAPRIVTMQIPKDKIGGVIGPGGKIIRGIIEQTGVKIDIEDSGKVSIATNDSESAQAAISIIEGLVAEAEVGKTYLGTITRLVDFGAFVEIMPGTEGLLHISEVANPQSGGYKQRAEGGGRDPGEGAQHRTAEQDPAQPEGRFERGSRAAAGGTESAATAPELLGPGPGPTGSEPGRPGPAAGRRRRPL